MKALILLILVTLLVVGCSTPTETIVKDVRPISTEKLDEICADIVAYTEYCYDTGISPNDCGAQMAEKIPRLYYITTEQLRDEVLPYCETQRETQ